MLAVATVATVATQDVRDTIGPLERSASPSSPENPIPRRTASAQAVLPPEWRQPAGRGLVRFQVTLNTSGRVAEIRRLGEPLVQFGVGTTVDDETRRTLAKAIVNSGAEALRRWAYEAPPAPITFHVVFTFYAAPEPTAVQQDPPPVPASARGALVQPASPPTPWPAAADAIRIGPGMKPPQVTKRGPPPRYTPEAMKAKIQGTVILEVVVGADGKVRDVRVVRSLPMLDGEAIAAAKQWEFTPMIVDGKPVPVLMLLEQDFNLR